MPMHSALGGIFKKYGGWDIQEGSFPEKSTSVSMQNLGQDCLVMCLEIL